MGIPIETVHAEGFAMDFFRFGHGEKTLVILPGLSVDSVMKYADAVADAYRLLTDDFTIYVFDRRKELPSSYSETEMAEDTAEAIRLLGLEQACIFGASQGGTIAIIIAARYPERVSRMVLASASAKVNPDHFRIFEKWIRLAEAGDAKVLYLAFGEAIFPPDVFEQSRDLLAAAAESVTDADLRRFVILAQGMKGLDLTEHLREVSCPVLVTGSMDDGVLGADASEYIAEHLKDHTGCELYMYNGYGHAVYDLAPDYKERLLNFLTAGSGQEHHH